MKRINPIDIWTPKGTKTCNTIDIVSLGDNLKDKMEIYYRIGFSPDDQEARDDNFTPVAEGNSTIEGAEYEALGSNGKDMNEEIKSTIIAKINLSLA
jgi:hypothetical protein